MVFDPMKFYDDGQRRQKRYDSLVPVFVVALVLLVAFGAGFVAYQRSHVKPKPVAPAVVHPKPMHDTEITCSGSWDASDEGCNTWRNQTAGCVSQLNGPVRCPGADGQYTPVDGKDVLEGFNQSRKHKRKADVMHFTAYYESPASYNPHAHVTLKELKDAQGYAHDTGGKVCILNVLGECWVTLDPDPKPDCFPGGCDHILQPVIRSNEDLVRAEKAAEYDQLALDHSGDFYDNVFVPGGECTDRERYRQLQCQMGGKCLLRNLDSKNWCKPETTPQDITNLMEQIAPTDKQEKPTTDDVPVHYWGTAGKKVVPAPDCKMPADVDVCPAQTLDPKAVDDKVGKP